MRRTRMSSAREVYPPAMPDNSLATRASVVAASRALSGSLLATVTYYGFSWDGGSWDHGTHHNATMGVELTSADDTHFVACWGDAFGHFGLELLVGDAAHIFQTCLERRDFSGHTWWAPFAQTPASAELIWRDDHSDVGGSAPVALALTAGEHCVWVVAAQPVESDASSMSRGGYLLGMDEVIVTGERHFAESIGIASER
jgi:hypothetical protein